MQATPDNWINITWRMRGDLKPVFARVSAEALARFLEQASAGVLKDAQANIAGKGWHKFGDAIRQKLNRQVTPTSAEVGSSHHAAAMREFGGTISAPGKGPLAVPAEALTIPLKGSPAKGKTVRQMEKSGWIIFRPKGHRVLMGVRQGARSTKKDPMRAQAVPLFALAKRVKHPPGRWFPTFAQIARRIDEAAKAL